MKPRQKWKPFNQKQINVLEQAYQKYLSKSAFQSPGWHKLDSNTEVCFEVTAFAMIAEHAVAEIDCSLAKQA